MAQVKGFKGLRYNTNVGGSIESLVCPPYDIISEEQRLHYIDENRCNVIL